MFGNEIPISLAGLCFYSVPEGALALQVPVSETGDVHQMRCYPALCSLESVHLGWSTCHAISGRMN